MAYDRVLAERIREELIGEPQLSEVPLFGGLGFLISGNPSIAVSGDCLLVRVPPGQASALLEFDHTTPAEIDGDALTDWLQVCADGITSTRQLQRWVQLGAACVRPQFAS